MDRWRPNWPRPLPDTVEVAAFRPMRALNLSRLEPPAKRRLWADIQAERPALAELLSDPTFRELRDAFDADVLVDVEELPSGDHRGPEAAD